MRPCFHSAGIATYPAGASFGPRRLRDYEFVWIIEGDAVARFDGVVVPAPAGTLLLGRPGMTDEYDWGAQRGTTHAYVHFGVRGVSRRADWPLARSLPAEDVARPLLRFVLGAQRLPASPRAVVMVPALTLLLRAFVSGHLATAPAPLPALPAAVERALTQMRTALQAQPVRSLSLATLAVAAHVSPEHLCRLFAGALGVGPRECWRLWRLERAASLLGRSNMAVKEIAERTGFVSPYHFSRAFKQVYRLAPRDYRQRVRAGLPAPDNPLVRRLPLWT